MYLKLTDKQRVILETILEFKKKHRRPPYKMELTEILPWHPTKHALAFSIRYLIQKDCLEKIPVPKRMKIKRTLGQEGTTRLIDITGFGLHALANRDFANTARVVKKEDVSKFITSVEEDELRTLMESVNG